MTDYAKERRHYIIENDYDSEFIYTGAQVNSLYQLAPERVIHVGTFSKTLAPFLRLGYMVVPGELVPRVKGSNRVCTAGSILMYKWPLIIF